MNKNVLLTTSLVALLSITAQARHHGGGSDHNRTAVTSDLTQEVQDTIVYAATEARMINDLYTNANSTVDSTTLVYAIQSSGRDESRMNRLAEKYDLNLSVYPESTTSYSADEVAAFESGSYIIEDVQSNYDTLYDTAIASEQAALEVGCMATVTMINDTNDSLTLATEINATDVMHEFNHIIRHGYKNYALFDTALKALDVTDGCCSLDAAYCHEEYPSYTVPTTDANCTADTTSSTTTKSSRGGKGGKRGGRR